MPDRFLRPQLFHEDAFTYFTGAPDGAAAILRPHSYGQLFVVQRLMAWAASPLPAEWMPLAYFIFSLAGFLAVLWYITQSSDVGPFMAIAAVSIYTSGVVYLHLVNLHWLLALATVTMVANPDPKTAWGKAGQAAALPLLTLSGSLGLILAPLFALRLVAYRSTHAAVLAALAVSCAVLGYASLVTSRGAGRFNPLDPHWQGFLGTHLSGSLFLGDWTETLPIAAPWYLFLTVVVLGGIAAYAIRKRDWQVGACLLSAGLVLASAARCWLLEPREVDLPAYRYYYVPHVCLCWCFILMVQRARGMALKFATMAVLGIGFAAGTRFCFPPLMDEHWSEGVRQGGAYVNPFHRYVRIK
jgi:hypothetical protein